MSEERPIIYWRDPNEKVRVIEEAEDIKLAVSLNSPAPPPRTVGLGICDAFSLGDELSILAGKELPLCDLVEHIRAALIRHGWISVYTGTDAATLARDIIEGEH